MLKDKYKFLFNYVKSLFSCGTVENKSFIDAKDISPNKVRYVLMHVATQDIKSNCKDTITDEFNEKIILYGYVMLFACSFSLGPLMLLLVILIDIRIDAKRLLWLYKRPIGKEAQDLCIF